MRKIRIFNDDWRFVKAAGDAADAARIAGESGEKIALPHTWNAVDGQDGGNDYHRGTCWYVKQFERPILTEGEEAWLEFRGVAITAEVWLNGQKLARHEGGYSTFRVDLTDTLQPVNTLVVSADNGQNRTVYPQKADFTF